MEKKIYRTVFRFEALSEEPINEYSSLKSVIARCFDGDWSGLELDNEVSNEELSGTAAVEAVRSQGADPEFFGMDDEGNEIED